MNDIDWGWLLFQFEGRINRAKFWLGGATIYIALWILWAIAFGAESGALISLVSLLSILAIWPYLAVSIKRWHDRDKSGWWVLIGFIPVIGFFWVLIELGFLPGTPGPNRYGPDPLVIDAVEGV